MEGNIILIWLESIWIGLISKDFVKALQNTEKIQIIRLKYKIDNEIHDYRRKING